MMIKRSFLIQSPPFHCPQDYYQYLKGDFALTVSKVHIHYFSEHYTIDCQYSYRAQPQPSSTVRNATLSMWKMGKLSLNQAHSSLGKWWESGKQNLCSVFSTSLPGDQSLSHWGHSGHDQWLCSAKCVSAAKETLLASPYKEKDRG